MLPEIVCSKYSIDWSKSTSVAVYLLILFLLASKEYVTKYGTI
jgi:hypothetical protein